MPIYFSRYGFRCLNRWEKLFSSASFKDTMDIKTFVFLDSETTGLPFQENNKTRITELCLIAVCSDHIRIGTFPRIQNKINLCFNPRKFISPDATQITGLSNELLENQPAFSSAAFNVIQEFLNLQNAPVCFVAHNGNRFDYPILRAELHRTGNKLPENILCVDSLQAFREILRQETDDAATSDVTTENASPQVSRQSVPIELQDGFDELLCSLVENLENSPKKLTPAEMQKLNETTPKSRVKVIHPKVKVGDAVGAETTSKENVKRQLRFGKRSFKLGDVYKDLTSKEPVDAHKAEVDVAMLIECAATVGEKFVSWSNLHAKKFCDIPMMMPGRAIGK